MQADLFVFVFLADTQLLREHFPLRIKNLQKFPINFWLDYHNS